MQYKYLQVQLESVRGDIANQPDIAAVVNAANAELRMGGGVARALHTKAGPGLENESSRLGPIRPGQAVITGAYELPNQYVIHCLGPVYGLDKPEDQLLAKCYENALRLADQNQISSIAFPAISTGVFGYPFGPATEVTLRAIRRMIPDLHNVQLIRFVLYSEDDLKTYQKKLGEIFPSDD